MKNRWGKLLYFVLFAVMVISCSSSSSKTKTFPKGFLWGVATAAEQCEGGITNNDWYLWEQMGNTPPVGLADNFYNLYATDFSNVASLHLNAFRLTFEWARIEPHPPAVIGMPLTSGDVDPTEVQHYRDVIASMKAYGLEPVVTLVHWTVPQWVDDPADIKANNYKQSTTSLAGWTNTLTAYAFSSYARFMAQQFSTTVKYWITENEPLPDTLTGYIAGEFPPGFSSLPDLTLPTMPNSASVVTVVKNMIMGHALAYHAIHEIEPNAMVSIAENSIFASPATNTASAKALASAFDHAYNLAYLDAVTKGIFDNGLTGTTNTEYHPEWAHTIDYIGVNYYENDYIVPAPFGLLAPIKALPCNQTIAGTLQKFGVTLGDIGCPAQNPSETQGLTNMLLEYANRYHLPMLITENGYGDADPVGRAKYIVQNIMAVKDAINRGADMIGYLYWTLDYDYEWTSGYKQNFGLFYVDDFTSSTFTEPTIATYFTRTAIHPATDVYSAIAAANDVTQTIIDQYGH